MSTRRRATIDNMFVIGVGSKSALSPIRDRRSCSKHRELDQTRMVYVDDFRLTGPPEAMKEVWRRIQAIPS